MAVAEMRHLPYVVCDVFTDRALTGNPLAVFTDARGLDARTMQQLAREMNLSETTFVFPPERGGDAKVRIFMPTCELPFAGHPTLGTAFVLAQASGAREVELELPIGPVPVRFEADRHFGWMTQPSPKVTAFDQPSALLDALELTASALPIELYDNGPRHVYIAADSHGRVADLHPNFSALAAFPHGVCVFHYDGQRCTARYFAAHAGINEDPATGSAAGPLAVHLARHGKLPTNGELTIEQGEQLGRPSRLTVRLTPAAERAAAARVEVGGPVVIVALGEFTLDLPKAD